MLRALLGPVAFLVSAALTLALLTLGGHRTTNSPADVPMPDPVEALIAHHGCWEGSAPAGVEGKIPGHVVVTRPGASAPEYAGPRMVGRALDHVFKGFHPRLAVHAFCR